MGSIFSELKRRNVFRVAAAYLVVGWLLAQVLGLAADSFEAPEWVMKMFITLLAIGFIPAVLFSWAYELTPEGIKKDSEVESNHLNSTQTSNKLNIVTLVAVIAAGGMFVYQQMTPPVESKVDLTQVQSEAGAVVGVRDNGKEQTKEIVDDASIAVLPFADLSPAGDQEYFSDGIAEEILNVLVRVEQLKVASRTSAFGFKGQEALGIPLIAEKLKVRHVLEGSVRKAGDTIRITAQLIDAQNDAHLWSQTYDRPLTAENIFAVQDEISAEIVKALREELQVELDDVQNVKINTKNLDAYELYIKARQLFFVRNQHNLPQIIELTRKATELDPEFAQAWAGLAAAHSISPSWGVDGSDEFHFEQAIVAANKAIKLNPNLSLAYSVLQNIEVNKIPVDFEKSMAYSDMALKLDPNNSTVQLWRGIDELVLGFFDKAIYHTKKCLEIDPDYANCRNFLALSKLYAGQTEEALEIFDQSIQLGGSSQTGPFYRTLFDMGEYRSALYMVAYGQASFPLSTNMPSETIYKIYTDENFNFNKEFKILVSAIENKTGKAFEWGDNNYNNLAYEFKYYEKIKPVFYNMLWWDRTNKEFLKSPHRNRLIREMGIYDYWKKSGFPPQCRPLAADDFECD